jgi:hypothetical protein
MSGELKPVYFDATKMRDPDNQYVCWFDVMGTQNQMRRSLPTSANFIMKLHCAVLEAHEQLDDGSRKTVELYPVMDGMYVTATRRQPLMTMLGTALRHLSETFLKEKTIHFRFLVRGAIAFGPVVHGRMIDSNASWVLDRQCEVRDALLLGMPLAQAYSAESSAPPFGVAVDESARAFCPPGDRPFRFVWWDWFSSVEPPLVVADMVGALKQYFQYQREHHHTTGYALERIDHHEQLAVEYFNGSG